MLKKEPMKKFKQNFTFRLPDELARELRFTAAAHGENASDIGRRGVERELRSIRRRTRERQALPRESGNSKNQG